MTSVDRRTRISLAEIELVMTELSPVEKLMVLGLESLADACLVAARTEDGFGEWWRILKGEVIEIRDEQHDKREAADHKRRMKAAAEHLGLEVELVQVDFLFGVSAVGRPPGTTRLYEVSPARKPHLVRWRRGRFIRACSGFHVRMNRSTGGEVRKGSGIELSALEPSDLCMNCAKVRDRACGLKPHLGPPKNNEKSEEDV